MFIFAASFPCSLSLLGSFFFFFLILVLHTSAAKGSLIGFKNQLCFGVEYFSDTLQITFKSLCKHGKLNHGEEEKEKGKKCFPLNLLFFFLRGKKKKVGICLFVFYCHAIKMIMCFH